MDAYITEARRKAEELKEKSRFMLLDTPSLSLRAMSSFAIKE